MTKKKLRNKVAREVRRVTGLGMAESGRLARLSVATFTSASGVEELARMSGRAMVLRHGFGPGLPEFVSRPMTLECGCCSTEGGVVRGPRGSLSTEAAS